MAALINEINHREARHIVIIEDPIEYEHQHVRSVIEQVEIGTDAPDFPTALRAALRQAPDIIVVGEMRDPETMRIAVAAAETGHLVFSTLHTVDVASTISRISDSFPWSARTPFARSWRWLSPPSTRKSCSQKRRRPRSRRGTFDDRLRCAPSRTQKRAATSSPGNSADQEKRFVYARRNASATNRSGQIEREDALVCAIHPDDLDILLKSSSASA